VTMEYTPERLGRTLLVTAEPITEGSGQVGTVCTVRDLSELRQIEAVARERQSLLEHVLESARENICAVDPKGHICWINSAGAAMNGSTKEALIGMHFRELVEESDRVVAEERFRRSLAGEPQTSELRLALPDGQVRYVVSDSTPLVIEGRTTGVLSITRDVTELRQERERAVQADKLRALGQLASGVAHDFNNSLAAIRRRPQLLPRAARLTELTRAATRRSCARSSSTSSSTPLTRCPREAASQSAASGAGVGRVYSSRTRARGCRRTCAHASSNRSSRRRACTARGWASSSPTAS